MTPAEMLLYARNRYNAVGDPHFSDQMLYDAIYQAQMQLCNEALVIERTYSTVSVASTREYAYPTNATAVRRVEYAGKKVCFTTLESDPKSSTTEVTGTPNQYAVWNGEIIFFPTPSVSADTIKVFTYNEPAAVTSASVLDVPSAYHLDMIEFMLSVMYAKDQNQGMSTFHRNLWESAIGRIKRHNAKKKTGDAFGVVRDEDYYSAPGAMF